MKPPRTIYPIFFFLFLSIIIFSSSCVPKHPQPNIILILVDALRADYLGCYGFEGNLTPNIDRFAQKSTIYESCYAAAPWTKPSVISIFTGLSPLRHRVIEAGAFAEWGRKMRPRWWREPLAPGLLPLEKSWSLIAHETLPSHIPTIAEVLGDHGYRTGLFNGGNGWITAATGVSRGFQVEKQLDSGPKARKFMAPAPTVLADAWKWIIQTNGRPFFTYIHLMDVHAPYILNDQRVESEIRNTVKSMPGLGLSRSISKSEMDKMPAHMDPEKETMMIDGRNIHTWKEKYATGVSYLDTALQTFLSDLESQGLLNNTLVIITADHGDEFLEHGGWDHGKQLFNELLHVPLIIHFPYDNRAGRRMASPVSSLDIFPTVLNAARIRIPGTIDGQVLRTTSWHSKQRWIISAGLEAYPFRAALQNGRHKMIVDIRPNIPDTLPYRPAEYLWNFPNNQSALFFDLKNDPQEQRAVSDAGSFLKEWEKVRPMVSRMLDHPSTENEIQNLSEDEKERLRSLGYLQ